MSPIKAIKDLPMWIKTVSAIVGLLVTFAGGLYAVEEHFVNEKENVETLQQMQMSLQTEMRFYRYDFIDSQYDKAKRALQENPEDPILKEEYEDLKSQREKLREELGF